jgi:glucokinase
VTARRFVVVSGIPGSGKTTLARRLAPAIGLPLIDKDDILERLFETRGIGDHAWRRSLSRESDSLFREAAERSVDGAVLVSFWHQLGMPADSGTPTSWLASLGRIVNVHCVCPPEIAAARFAARKRHHGHLDSRARHEDLLRQLRMLSELGPLGIADCVEVDTSAKIDIDGAEWRAIVSRLS